MFIILGIFFGLMAAVPLGPVNFFVVAQALKRDFLHGLLAGLTAAFLDTAFCFVALAGFFQVKINLPPYSMSVLKVVAGGIILMLARKLIQDSKTFEIPQDRDNVPPPSPKPILGVILLYVTNPTLYMLDLRRRERDRP
jgi:L-lysine exporter family protein LysE/ArgO